jgi:NAD(P)-dependent dehydrogenase (short-subunit alcohol dehydrogenase family)
MKTKSTILITGCSSGFGKATAELFLARDWNVIATMRSPKPGLSEASNRLLVTSLDVTDPTSVSEAIEKGIAQFGKIDVIVNNAGIGLFGAHEATSDEVIRQVFETNTFGVMAVNRAIAPHMRERGSGTIINVTSSVGIAPMPLVAAYAASKYAIEGFSESLAYELGMFGVRVKIVQPGLAPSTFRCQFRWPLRQSDSRSPTPTMRALPQINAGVSTAYTSAADVAEAVYAAATDGRDSCATRDADSACWQNFANPYEQTFIARMRNVRSEPVKQEGPVRSVLRGTIGADGWPELRGEGFGFANTLMGGIRL